MLVVAVITSDLLFLVSAVFFLKFEQSSFQDGIQPSSPDFSSDWLLHLNFIYITPQGALYCKVKRNEHNQPVLKGYVSPIECKVKANQALLKAPSDELFTALCRLKSWM